MSGPAIEAQGLTKAFGATPVLRGVDLTVAAGEAVAVIGPSGSGKSTLLRCIAGLEAFDGGTLQVADRAGEPGQPRARALMGRVGFVFQSFNLFPHLTALENITLAPVRVNRTAPAAARAEGLALLEKVGLGGRGEAYPSELSGGQQQRCAIARALAMAPEVLLFDEPTSALDPELVAEVLEVIAALAREGRTLMIVTHQMAFAREVAGRTLFMDEGGVVEEGPSADLFAHPRTERLQRFLDRALKATAG
jgi:L-cystine transport system ATP-binding protein